MKRLLVVIVCVLLLAVAFVWYSLQPSRKKMGEVTFHQDANLELKVISIFENLPMHFRGTRLSVACKSKNTNDLPEVHFDMIEKGWKRMPDSVLLSQKREDPIESLAEVARKYYQVMGAMTVTVTDNMYFSVSFDGCKSFATWMLMDHLPKSMIVDSTPESDNCEAQKIKDQKAGLQTYGDCEYFKFTEANTPEFSLVSASDDGRASFVLASKSLRDQQPVKIETQDFGKTWQIQLLTVEH